MASACRYESLLNVEFYEYRGPVVYCISNNYDGKLYIGQASNYRVRMNSHKADFRRGRHYNKRLQRIYDKYPNSLTISILEFADRETLTDKEKFWIEFLDTRNREKGYNIIEGGRMIKPVPHTLERIKRQVEAFKKTIQSDGYKEYRKMCSERLSKNPLMKGKTHTESWKNAVQETHRKRKERGIRIGIDPDSDVRVTRIDTGELIKEYLCPTDAMRDLGISGTAYYNRYKKDKNWKVMVFSKKNIKLERKWHLQ